MVEDLRHRRATHASAAHFQEPRLVTHQIRGSRSQNHTHSRPGNVRVKDTGISQRFTGSNHGNAVVDLLDEQLGSRPTVSA